MVQGHHNKPLQEVEMNKKNLGYDPKTGRHSQNLTEIENRFLAILWTNHADKNNKISATELAIRFNCAICGFEPDPKILPAMIKKASGRKETELQKRLVRRIQLHLLRMHDNIPVLSKAGYGGGYWIESDEEEAKAFYESFRKRGLTGLIKAARGKKSVLVDMVKQLSFEFEDMVDLSNGSAPRARKAAGTSAPVAVVDAFLEKMLKDPERFSSDLEKIGRKFGSILLPKSRVAEMQKKAAELQELVSSLQI